MSHDSLQQWQTRVLDALAVLGGDTRGLVSIPDGGTPAERLKALLSVWDRCQFQPGVAEPWSASLSAMTARARTVPEQFLPAMALQLQAGIVAALDAGAQQSDTPVFAIASTPHFVALDPERRLQWVVFAHWHRLPDHHPLRVALPAEKCWRDENGQPTFLLGFALPGTAQPAPLFRTADVVALTQSWRQPQALREDEIRRRAEAEQRQRQAMESDTVKIRRLEKQLAQLLAEREQPAPV